MLHLVVALSAASPIVLEHRAVVALRLWAGTVFRLLLGVIVATVAYFGVLDALVHSYGLTQPFGAIVYSAGFMLATLFAVVCGTLVSPARWSRVMIPSICGLGVMFPLGLNIYFGLMEDWRPVYLLYILGSVWGGYAIAWLAASAQGVARFGRI